MPKYLGYFERLVSDTSPASRTPAKKAVAAETPATQPVAKAPARKRTAKKAPAPPPVQVSPENAPGATQTADTRTANG